jgi:autotransporter-associated beta strand protein
LADNLTVTNTSTLTLTNIISGTGYGITKLGSGTLVLGGSNTFSGGLTVSNGTLNVTNSYARAAAI